MSGHSKWAQIKRQKGVADIKRGQTFTKLSNAITIAVKESGGIADPNTNFKLRLAMERAKTFNMPKANIERAIDRGKVGDRIGIEEVLYEGFAPGGVAVMAEATTDNKQRTASEIKNIFEKAGGTLGSSGSVAYQFVQKGLITVKKGASSFDDIFMIALESGAQDLEDAGNEIFIYTDPTELGKTREELLKKNLEIIDAELVRKPVVLVNIDNSEVASKILSFVEKIEGLDDVQKVYANFDISDEILGQLQKQIN